MCGGTSFWGPVVGSFVSGIFGSMNKPKDQPAIPAPAPPPQAAVTPEQPAFKKKLASAVGDPTALTGPGGVADFANSLGGKSTLLGA